MRRSFLTAAALGAPLLVSLVLLGCGRPKDEEDAGAGDSGGAVVTATPAADLQPLPPGPANAVLKGKVTLQGAPDTAAEQKQMVAAILNKADQKATCYDLAPPAERDQQKWVLGPGGAVANVVVWILPPDGYYFDVDLKTKTWPDAVALTQPHCAFIPHVTWIMPEVVDPNDHTKRIPSGQKFTVSNTAPVSHNTAWHSEYGADNSQLGTLPAGTLPKEVALKGDHALVHFNCNIHPWMDAYVWVFDHPYAAVTDADGNYTIKNVPVGSKVRITAWHEMGPKKFNSYLTAGKSKGDEIELKEGENVHDFVLPVDAK